MSKIFVGIDPGLKGAIAILSDGNLTVSNVPTHKSPTTGKPEYSIDEMVNILRPYCKQKVTVVIEHVHAMPGQGVTSMFTFGRGKGIWEGICYAFNFKVNMVTPQTWKKEWPELIVPRISKDNKPKTENEKREAATAKRHAKARSKEQARELAAKLYPLQSDEFDLVSSDGKAEAALLARYASLHFED